MRVSGEHERQAQRGGLVQPARVVGKQHRERRATARESRDVRGTPRPVIEAEQVDGLAAHGEPQPGVVDHRHSRPSQDLRHFDIVVVIAEHPEDAVRRAQSREWSRRLADVAAIAERHIVAAEHHQIGRFSLQQ